MTPRDELKDLNISDNVSCSSLKRYHLTRSNHMRSTLTISSAAIHWCPEQICYFHLGKDHFSFLKFLTEPVLLKTLWLFLRYSVRQQLGIFLLLADVSFRRKTGAHRCLDCRGLGPQRLNEPRWT